MNDKDIFEEQVNHPIHYNIPGRKECIEEMIEKYGPLAVYNFCMCNAYKYSYRAGYKDDKEQDLKKAEWYIKKGVELLPQVHAENTDLPALGIQEIADHYGWRHQVAKLREELQELDEAVGEYLFYDDDNTEEHLQEEIADVIVMINQIMYLGGSDFKQGVDSQIDYKINRQLRRREIINKNIDFSV